jgi:hypothetical protein
MGRRVAAHLRAIPSERAHFGIVRIARHVDQTLVSARVVEAEGNKPLHAQVPHVPERHRIAGWVHGL